MAGAEPCSSYVDLRNRQCCAACIGNNQRFRQVCANNHVPETQRGGIDLNRRRRSRTHGQPGCIADYCAGAVADDNSVSGPAISGSRGRRCVARRSRSRDVRAKPLPLIGQRCGAARNYLERGRLSRGHRLLNWLGGDTWCNHGCGRKTACAPSEAQKQSEG